jgi:hypothetical protein
MGQRRKPRTHTGRRSLALPAIVFGVLLILAALILLTQQNAGGGTPRLAVDTQKIDYGYVKFGETRAFEIRVSNAGDGVLRFEKEPYIEVLEGC